MGDSPHTTQASNSMIIALPSHLPCIVKLNKVYDDVTCVIAPQPYRSTMVRRAAAPFRAASTGCSTTRRINS